MDLGTLIREARTFEDWIVELRRTIHRKPELMYEEVETSALVQKTLRELGIPFEAGIAETGVLATLGDSDGPCVALRADMDALPIHEEADVDFRSEVPGKMHACGHDCHTAMLLGAARLLKSRESEIRGTVKLVFQPAEEGGAGGKRMREHGILRAPEVQRIFGLHVWPLADSGEIASRAGTFLAAAASLEIRIQGKGGHAALPHLTIDPVVTSARIISELQTIVSREADPLTPLVISITTVHGGDAHNVIPEEVKLGGTIRTLSSEHMTAVQSRVREVADRIAVANRCQAEVHYPGEDYPPTANDAECWRLAGDIWKDEFGGQTVHTSPPIMGGEDFAFYTEEVPGCFVGLGIHNPDEGCTFSVHHPKFKADESVLPLGSAMHVAYAFRSLEELRAG
ncbi:hypothetical protein ABI59_07490 [Acidobacteria bacterium Mor1]|nr:hypothetical protein ABI59_07490 [Acidobacteria bacterium Mor1]